LKRWEGKRLKVEKLKVSGFRRLLRNRPPHPGPFGMLKVESRGQKTEDGPSAAKGFGVVARLERRSMAVSAL